MPFWEAVIKKIIHVDADCFFAALEMRDNPHYKAVPLAVGGDPGRRGVIATCNYVARQYGVHSAMASAYAMRLCPALVIVQPNFERYRSASLQMREIFTQYTDQIEPLSLDEAYLDVSESEQFKGSATLIAEDIRQTIHKNIGITVSAGIAPVKFLAKIASDWRKPNGVFTVAPPQVQRFVRELPLKLLPGVGKVTSERLARFGLYYCKDVLDTDESLLIRHFGSFGHNLIKMSKGVDDRAVLSEHDRKSLSVERTYAEDVQHIAVLNNYLDDLIEALRHRHAGLSEEYYVKKLFIKLKFNDFSQTTMEMPLVQCSDPFSSSEFQRLLQVSWRRQNRPVRLLGIGFRVSKSITCSEQLLLPLR